MKKTKHILVLDLGTSNIKLAEVQARKRKTLIKSFCIEPVPNELRGITSVNVPAYIDFIRKLISLKNITAKDAIVCISGTQLEVKNLMLPKMKQKELVSSMDWQSRDVLSMPAEEAVIDYMIQGDLKTTDAKEMDLCIAAIPKNTANEYASFLQELNLTPLAFVIEPQSAWQVIKDCPFLKNKKTIALINMGAEKTFISVFSDGKLKHMKSLPISGNKFTEGITQRVVAANGENLNKEKAEFLKCKYGIPELKKEMLEENVSPQDIFVALRPFLEDMVSELMRFLEFYKSEHPGENIEILAVYGGSSRLLGISDYISKNIGIPVISQKLTDLRSIEIVNKEELEGQGAFLVNVTGAGLLREKAINLLPPAIKINKELKRKKAALIKMWIGFVIAVSVFYMSLSFIGLIKQKDFALLKNSYDNLTALKEELSKYNIMVNEYNSKTELANELIRSEPFWEDLFKEISVLTPDNIVINEFVFDPLKQISYGAAVSPLAITGVVFPKDSPPEEDLTKFLQNMEKSRCFNKIKLEYSKEGKIKEEKVLEFKIGCDIR